MQINSVNGTGSDNGISGGTAGMDAYSKSILKEIENIRQQMQELSQNDSMSMEEKMKKKQQLQQRINELNNELRKHEIEQRRQKQEASASKNDTPAEPPEKSSGAPSDGLSAGSMQAMISADATMEISQAGRRAARELKGTARVLKGEIEASAGQEKVVEAKKMQLQEIERRAANAESDQYKHLGEAVHDMREAAGPEKDVEKEEQEEQKSSSAEDDGEQQVQSLRKVDVLL